MQTDFRDFYAIELCNIWKIVVSLASANSVMKDRMNKSQIKIRMFDLSCSLRCYSEQFDLFDFEKNWKFKNHETWDWSKVWKGVCDLFLVVKSSISVSKSGVSVSDVRVSQTSIGVSGISWVSSISVSTVVLGRADSNDSGQDKESELEMKELQF